MPLQTVTNRQNGEDPIQNEIANFYHRGGDSVVDIQFSFVAPYEVLTVGGSGHVYHWDMEYALSKFDENADNNEPQEASEELQTHSLKFVHTGGSRRVSGRGQGTSLAGTLLLTILLVPLTMTV